MAKKLPETESSDFDIYEIPSVAGKGKPHGDAGKIPDAVIKRLPRYFRFLRDLINSDVLRISSVDLAKLMSCSASQIRQDLCCFGGYGTQGYGYNVMNLYTRISEILGVTNRYSAVMIGAGCIASSLVNERVFEKRGINLRAIFGIEEKINDFKIGSHLVRRISDFLPYCEENDIDIAIVAVAPEGVDGVLKLIKQTKIRGIWNYSAREITEYNDSVCVVNVFPADTLMLLTCEMSKRDNGNQD